MDHNGTRPPLDEAMTQRVVDAVCERLRARGYSVTKEPRFPAWAEKLITLVVAVLLAWGAMQTRVAVLETRQTTLEDALKDFRSDLRDIRGDIRQLLERQR